MCIVGRASAHHPKPQCPSPPLQEARNWDAMGATEPRKGGAKGEKQLDFSADGPADGPAAALAPLAIGKSRVDADDDDYSSDDEDEGDSEVRLHVVTTDGGTCACDTRTSQLGAQLQLRSDQGLRTCQHTFSVQCQSTFTARSVGFDASGVQHRMPSLQASCSTGRQPWRSDMNPHFAEQKAAAIVVC